MSDKKLKELLVPPAVKTDPNAFEIARIWATHNSQHVSLNIIWDDPAAWGMMLVDLARHAADYYHQTQGVPTEKCLARIKEGFDSEWTNYTTDLSGEILDKSSPKDED
jgi:hypothetical protein